MRQGWANVGRPEQNRGHSETVPPQALCSRSSRLDPHQASHSDQDSSDAETDSALFSGTGDAEHDGIPFQTAYVPRCLVPPCVRRRTLPPMDAETYRVVLASLGRLQEKAEPGPRDEDKYTESELCLRQDMTKNKVVWCGSYWEDFWYFLTNIHPVLAVCYSHPLHPISRVGRLVIYGLSFFFVVLTSMAVSQGAMCRECRVCSVCDINYCVSLNNTCAQVYNLHNTTRTLRIAEADGPAFVEFMGTFCCQVERWGALTVLDTYGFTRGSVIYSFLMNMIFSFCCFQLLLCGCVQMRSRRSRALGQWAGRLLFVSVAIIVVWRCRQQWWGYNWTHSRLSFAIQTFVTVKLVSWTGASVLDLALFTVLFHIQREKAPGSCLKWLDAPQDRSKEDSRSVIARMLNPRFHVTAVEYLKALRQLELLHSSR